MSDCLIITDTDDSQQIVVSGDGGLSLVEIAAVAVPPGASWTIGPCPPGPGLRWMNGAWMPDPAVTAAMVTAERDRRLRGTAPFRGNRFQTDAMSMLRITGAGALALGAISAGKQPGDLRWHDGTSDFVWTAEDNTEVPMDAQTMFSFAQSIAQREAAHVKAARALKDQSPIPADYTADPYWPA